MQLNTTDISHHFGFTMPSAFIAETLGVPPVAKAKKGSLWETSQLPAIGAALAKYAVARAAEPADKKPKKTEGEAPAAGTEQKAEDAGGNSDLF